MGPPADHATKPSRRDDARRPDPGEPARGSDDEWERGKGWAFEQAIGAAWYYEETNLDMHEMGMTTLRRLLESETSG